MYKALVVNVDTAAVLVGVVVVYERRLHAAVAQIHAAAVARGVVLGHGTVSKVGVLAVHVDTGAAVGIEVVKPSASLGITAHYGYAVERGNLREGVFVLHGGKPYHVARV